MAISWKADTDPVRENIFNELVTYMRDRYDDVMQVKSNEFCFPMVGPAGTDCFIKITVSVPKGSKGEPYDGYNEAESFKFEAEEKARKAKEKEAEKEAKKKRDAEMRAKREEIAKNNSK